MISMRPALVAAVLALSTASSGAFAATVMTPGDAGTRVPKVSSYQQISAMSPTDQMMYYNHLSRKNQMMMMKKCPGNAGESKAAPAFCHRM